MGFFFFFFPSVVTLGFFFFFFFFSMGFCFAGILVSSGQWWLGFFWVLFRWVCVCLLREKERKALCVEPVLREKERKKKTVGKPRKTKVSVRKKIIKKD